MGNAPRWFQLYWVNDREIAASFVKRAEAAGYGAIVLTVDTLTLGWRPRDLRSAYLPFIHGRGLRAVLHRPRLPQPAGRSRPRMTCSPPRCGCSARSRTCR